MLFAIKDTSTLIDLKYSRSLHLSSILLSFLNTDFKRMSSSDNVLDFAQNNIDNTEDITSDNHIFYTMNKLIYNYLNISLQFNQSVRIYEEDEEEENNIKEEGDTYTSTNVIEIDNHLGWDVNELNFKELFSILSKERFEEFIQLQNNISKLVEDIFIKKLNKIDLNIYVGDINYYIKFYEGEITETYDISTIDSYCIFAISKLFNSNLSIKRCENCENFFIPSDSREIYCDKIHPNGRTCKQMGYENKINSDEIMREYRRVYKNKNATKNRNKNDPNSEIEFKQWVNATKLKLDMCKDGDITLDEFKSWLNNN